MNLDDILATGRVHVSPPDFIQVLPDPVFVLRLSGLEQGGHLPPVAGKEGEEAP